jgi:hypothetical protein
VGLRDSPRRAGGITARNIGAHQLLNIGCLVEMRRIFLVVRTLVLGTCEREERGTP